MCFQILTFTSCMPKVGLPDNLVDLVLVSLETSIWLTTVNQGGRYQFTFTATERRALFYLCLLQHLLFVYFLVMVILMTGDTCLYF